MFLHFKVSKPLKNFFLYSLLAISLGACGGGGGSPADPEDPQAGGPNNPPADPPVEFTLSLNDTGVTGCSDGSNPDQPCPQASYPDQDAERGRDVTHSDPADGHAGFSFVQIGNNGNPLETKSTDFAVTPWSCVLDTTTGLMWEVKTNDIGLRDKNWTYSWYNSTGINDGGDPGTSDTGIEDGNDFCLGEARCDSEKYVADVNSAGLCGYSDWRLPSIEELMDLADMSKSTGQAFDANYFPTADQTLHMSSTTRSFSPSRNLVLSTGGLPVISSRLKSNSSMPIMLVRGP